ncbi:MAG TPA: LPS assembly protein LptD, partial [Nitrospirota bacterium]|nr:LPS assembly protein LptD [Nitrospirota bacterium]
SGRNNAADRTGCRMKEMNSRKSFILLLICLCTLVAPGPRVIFGQEPPKKVPVKVRADKLDYDKTADVYIAEGHVRVEQEDVTLDADRVMLDNKTGQVTAEGTVYLQQKGEVLRADRLEINLTTRAGTIQNGDIFMIKDNYHLKGERIEKRSDTVFRIEEGSFTTCDEGEWSLRAKEIEVDMDRYATGTHVSFNMGGLPLFYTPYLLFPVRRQTGLLIPELGVSSSKGFLMKNNFFWAISDYQDMTFTSDYRRKQGHGSGIEYRYVNSQDSSGRMYYNYFDLLDTPRHLWEFTFLHREEIAEDLSMRANINLVSDFSYFRELEDTLELRSRPFLDSNAFYVERWDSASLYLMGKYTTDLTTSNEKTSQKLPELRYSIFPERVLGPLYLGFEGSAVNFAVREGYGVRRADFNPRMTLTLSGGGLSIAPWVGMRGTFYDRSKDNPAEPTDLQYVYAGADLNARLSRLYGSDTGDGIGKVRHSIEPMASYEYLPRVDIKKVPQFDSLDSVSRRNLIKFSLINRLTANYHETGKTRTFDLMVFSLTQSYDLLEARYNDQKTADQKTAKPRSEILGEIVLRTPSVLTISASGSYNTYSSTYSNPNENKGWTTSSESMNINTEPVQFSATHQYLRETGTTKRTEYLTGTLGFNVLGWNVQGGLWYDLENRNTTQKEFRTTRRSQCWGLGLSYIVRPGETKYLLSLELKGLGTLKF